MDPLLTRAIFKNRWVQVSVIMPCIAVGWLVFQLTSLRKELKANTEAAERRELKKEAEHKKERDSLLIAIDRRDEIYIASIKENSEKIERKLEELENEKKTVTQSTKTLKATQNINVKLLDDIQNTADKLLKQKDQ